jgi:hypothetical protein
MKAGTPFGMPAAERRPGRYGQCRATLFKVTDVMDEPSVMLRVWGVVVGEAGSPVVLRVTVTVLPETCVVRY